MSDKIVSATIEILGKIYPVRCSESEVKSLQKAALFLNEKMLEVKESGKAINLERIAIMTALNISHQFLEQNGCTHRVNQRLTLMQDKLDTAINKALQKELLYAVE